MNNAMEFKVAQYCSIHTNTDFTPDEDGSSSANLAISVGGGGGGGLLDNWDSPFRYPPPPPSHIIKYVSRA